MYLDSVAAQRITALFPSLSWTGFGKLNVQTARGKGKGKDKGHPITCHEGLEIE